MCSDCGPGGTPELVDWAYYFIFIRRFEPAGHQTGGWVENDSIWVPWAVRDGDVQAAVPEPSTIFLLGAGLLGLIRSNRRKNK